LDILPWLVCPKLERASSWGRAQDRGWECRECMKRPANTRSLLKLLLNGYELTNGTRLPLSRYPLVTRGVYRGYRYSPRLDLKVIFILLFSGFVFGYFLDEALGIGDIQNANQFTYQRYK
jgi:hypothetical protein